MGWRRNIRCLMLATLVLAASTSVNAARPGFLRVWRPPRIQVPPRIRVVPPPVQRPPIRNNGLRWGLIYGGANAGNGEHMRAVENINRKQTHPSPGYNSYPYSQQPGSSNMGTSGTFTSDRDFLIRFFNAERNARAKSIRETSFSKNNYQNSSDANVHYRSIHIPETAEQVLRYAAKVSRSMQERIRGVPGVGHSFHKSDQEESTTVKIHNRQWSK